jgi:ketosteroid isomerase-like protein
MPPTHAEIVLAAVDAFNRGDFGAALDAAADDVTWAPFLARTETALLRGKDEIREAWARQLDVMDLEGATEVVFDEGRRVVARTRISGRGHGSDVPIEAEIVHVVEFDADVIVSIESYDDVDDALRSAGSGTSAH